MSIPDRLRLPIDFDVESLAAEARRLPETVWERHFNTAYYEGDWSGIALRSTGGAVSLYSDASASAVYEDTEHLERCPSVREALSAFRCELRSVRFLRLGPGARIREHRDYQIGIDYGEVRLHVPLETSVEAEFVLDGTPLEMRAGECWYVGVDRPHRLWNGGDAPRTHLVIDCIFDAWLRGTFEDALRTPLDRFAAIVESDAALAGTLGSIGDSEAFVARTVALAAEHGVPIHEADVRVAMHDGRARWYSRDG